MKRVGSSRRPEGLHVSGGGGAVMEDGGGNLKPAGHAAWETDGWLGEEKLELKLLGLGAILQKWGVN